MVSKLILNSLYGKFGGKEYNEETAILSHDEVDLLSRAYNIMEIKKIANSDKEIVTYEIHPNEELCKNNNIDYVAELLKLDNYGQKNRNISVCVASAITAYGRVYMSKFKSLPGLVYSDTDSLVNTNSRTS